MTFVLVLAFCEQSGKLIVTGLTKSIERA